LRDQLILLILNNSHASLFRHNLNRLTHSLCGI
jgi:hypothetical protein